MNATLKRPVDLAIGHAPTVCHLYPDYGNAPRSYCGVPREEQQHHRIPDAGKTAPTCPKCGAPRCPVCAAHHRRRYG